MVVKALTFDFFGVMSIRSHVAFLETAINDHDKLMHIYELRRKHDLGYIGVEDFLKAVGEATGLPPERVLRRMHHERVINEQLIKFIREELKPNYRIGLLSNAASDLRTFISVPLLKQLFDDVLISADVGMVKPDPRIFALACERLGTPPEETILVDDLPDNCEGAEAAGLKAIHYQTFPQCRDAIRALLK